MKKDQVREYLSKLDIHKSMGTDGMHQSVEELTDVMASLGNLSMIMATVRDA